MKLHIALIAIITLSTSLAACGGTDTHTAKQTPSRASVANRRPADTTATNAPPAPAKTETDADSDNDIGAPDDDTSNNDVSDFGNAAKPSDRQRITALIKRYYAAASAENGAKACSMLYSSLRDSVPQDYGQSPPSQPYMRGTTCAVVMTLLFKHYHPQIRLEQPRLEVADVRLIEHHGLAVLHFGSLPVRQILVAREGRTWKLESLLDAEVP